MSVKFWNYSEYLRSQFDNKEVGEEFELDMKDKPLNIVRALLRNATNHTVQTRYNNETGRLIIKIISLRK